MKRTGKREKEICFKDNLITIQIIKIKLANANLPFDDSNGKESTKLRWDCVTSIKRQVAASSLCPIIEFC